MGKPFLTNNNAKLIRGGGVYFDTLVSLIHAAKHTIHLQTYIFDEDDTGRMVAHALMDAARRGVKVYIVVDGYASQGLSEHFIAQLRQTGIHFRLFEPLFKGRSFYFGRRLHHKITVVDGCYSLVGGINISDHYNDTIHNIAWLDWAVLTEGEISQELEQVCARRVFTPSLLRKRKLPLPAPKIIPPESACAMRVLINDWVNRKREITRSYVTALRHASQSITIMSSYFIPGNLIKRNLLLALKRGVNVQLVLAGVSDVWLSKNAERYMYYWLLKNNVIIYEYNRNVLHAKLAIADSQYVTVGSYNVNNISAYASIECNVEIDNKTFALDAEAKVQRIITKDCVRITRDEFIASHRFWHRILYRISYDIFRLLLFLFTFYFRQRN